MMLIIFNIPGIIMVLISFFLFILSVFLLNVKESKIAALSTFIIFGAVMVLSDLLYRFKIYKGKDKNLWRPSKGGSIFWIPCWIIGGVIILLISLASLVLLISK